MRRINPSVKAITILAAALIMAFGYSIVWNLCMIGFCLICMLVSKADLKKLLIVLIPVSVAAVSLFFAVLAKGDGMAAASARETLSGTFTGTVLSAAGFHDALALALRIYAFSFMGMLFALTTDANDFIYSLMQQLHLSPRFAYGLLAAINLIPMLTRELKVIRLAYKVRGYTLSLLSVKPAFTALTNAVRWAESLAAAMESKGFDENGERTYSRTMKVRPADIVWAAAVLAIAAAGILFR